MSQDYYEYCEETLSTLIGFLTNDSYTKANTSIDLVIEKFATLFKWDASENPDEEILEYWYQYERRQSKELWQERVKAEKAELDSKIEKLQLFVDSDRFFKVSQLDGELLIKQLELMKQYSQVLSDRINNWH